MDQQLNVTTAGDALVMNAAAAHYDGGCTCRYVRYRMSSKPLFVHCCHCRWCQRETGALRFVRVGTLDEPDFLPPDIHIYTEFKQPWVVLPPDARAVPRYYKASEHWPRDSLERCAALSGRSPQP